VNGKTAYKGAVSNRLSFKDPDAVPDALLTDIVWHAVRGTNAPMPPIRSGLSLTSSRARPR
jgi:hypothetical protein